MSYYWWLLFVLFTVLLASCALEEFKSPPSPALIATSGSLEAERQTLLHGYTLFVSRCLECHALPSTTKYSKDEWPYLVSRMANRARLSNADQAAVIAYLRAACTTAP
jgi:hypothetical protein